MKPPEGKYFNCRSLKKTYVRNYKCGSQSVLEMMPNWVQSINPEFERFSIVRHPVERAKSIYKEMVKRKLHREKTFLTWLKLLFEEGFYHNHQFTQTELLTDSYPIRLFTIDQMDDVISWVGVQKNKIPHTNQNKQKLECGIMHNSLIASIYHDDFALYEHVERCQKKDGIIVKNPINKFV